LDGTLVGKVDIVGGLKKNGFVLANYAGTPKELQKALGADVECHTVDATAISMEEMGKPMANTAILGALTKVSPMVTYSALEDQITSKFSGKLSDKMIVKNLTALKRAYEEVQ